MAPAPPSAGAAPGQGGLGGESDTPILKGLDAVFRGGTRADAVLIDDAGLFGTDAAYPTVADLERRVHAARPDWVVRVEDDIVQMYSA